MQAHRALIKFSRIHDAMHGISRVDRAGMRDIHFDGIKNFKLTATSF